VGSYRDSRPGIVIVGGGKKDIWREMEKCGLVSHSRPGVGGGRKKDSEMRRHQHAQPIHVLMAEFQTLRNTLCGLE
jgi:hypothetical protein